MEELSMKNFAMLMWRNVFEACSQICYLTGSCLSARNNPPNIHHQASLWKAVEEIKISRDYNYNVVTLHDAATLTFPE